MRIAVIGAGLAGATTAYELAREGHEVSVFERRGSIAAEGSFAPACVAAPGLWLAHAAVGAPGGMEGLPWPQPWRLGKLRWLLKRRQTAQQPLQRARLATMQALSVLGQQCRRAAESAHQLDFESHRGVLAVFRTPRHAARAQALLAEFAALKPPAKWLDADHARLIEPSLSADPGLTGALHWPAGETANGRQFAHALKMEAQRLGARFLFHHEVVGLAVHTGRTAPIELRVSRAAGGDSSQVSISHSVQPPNEEGSQHFEAVALCSATGAAALLSPLGLHLPVANAHVHSVTAPLSAGTEAGPAPGPMGAVLDPAARISFGRMGERLRVASGAALGTVPAQPENDALNALYRALEASFPGAARTAKAQPWVGRQSLLPDGLPAVGPSGVQAVWLNLGHGPNAWAWAGAGARLVAEQICHRSASIDSTALSPSRLR